MIQALETLGIRLREPIPLAEMLSENFNPGLYDLTPSQVRRIASLREIVYQYGKEKSRDCTKEIRTSRDAALLLRGDLADLQHEEVWVIYIDNSGRALKKEMLFRGGLDSCSICTKTVIAKALSCSATNIILAHNHPSGNPSPGQEDIKRTGEIQSACKAVGLILTDHVILSPERYFSFDDEKTLPY